MAAGPIARERDTWQQVNGSQYFYTVTLPMSQPAEDLHGGPRPIFFGEFHTTDRQQEADWREYLYDPLSVLLREGVPLPPVPTNGGHSHLGINVLKLEGEPGEDDFEDARAFADREGIDALRQRLHVSTMVLNHELKLNPQIGIT